jgi:hypothetical protein
MYSLVRRSNTPLREGGRNVLTCPLPSQRPARKYLLVLQNSLDVWASKARCQPCQHHALGLELMIRADKRGIPIRATTRNCEMKQLIPSLYRQDGQRISTSSVDAIVTGEEACRLCCEKPEPER